MSESTAETCVLCGGPADQLGRFCIACVGGQGPSSAPRWFRPVSVEPARLGAVRALRWPLVVLLLAAVGLAGARAGESWMAARQLGRVVGAGRHPLGDQRLRSVMAVEVRLSAVQLTATLAIGAVFLVWWALAYRNLRALGVRPQATTGWAVASWFVPFVSLVAPKRVAEELWWGSDAHTPLGWTRNRGTVSALVTGWWLCWLASFLLPPLSALAVAAVAATRPDLVAGSAMASGLSFAASAVLLGVAGLCAVALVINITAAQEERAEAIAAAGLVATTT